MFLISRLWAFCKAVFAAPIVFGFIIWCIIVIMTGTGSRLVDVLDRILNAARAAKGYAWGAQRNGPRPAIRPNDPIHSNEGRRRADLPIEPLADRNANPGSSKGNSPPKEKKPSFPAMSPNSFIYTDPPARQTRRAEVRPPVISPYATDEDWDTEDERLLQAHTRTHRPKLDTFMFGENRHPTFDFIPMVPAYHGAHGLQELAVPKFPGRVGRDEQDIIKHGLEELNFD